jgi:UDP-N-acetylmuramoyl-L-alanyl-D-glutamate--2,6-diaminopimelate ligase
MEVTSVNTVSYSAENPCSDISAKNIQHEPSGLFFEVAGSDLDFPVFCHLIGAHNVSNCLAAIAVTHFGLNISVDQIQKGIKNLKIIPGRMEQIDLGQDFLAVVDFAHTPNALHNALETARELTDGNVLAVFGSAGLRDKDKRILMAEISADLANMTFLTAEDPRTESLDDILDEMVAAVVEMGGVEGKTFWRIPDRGEAIRTAVRKARSGDIVISLGKGHEQSMCFGEIEYPWDDRKAMRAALAEHLNIKGYPMPYLPTQNNV